MLAGRDSAYAPSDAQLADFYAAGVRVFGGYIKLGNDGIYHGWAQADFARVVAHEMIPVAYMSGWDDPAQARAVANSWGVLIVLVDVESGIRPDGTWLQGWLSTAQAGEYGNLPVHHYTATIHEDSGYYGYNPGATWPTWVTRPAGICGWQWEGSHDEYGLTVDSAWWDDGISALFSGASGSLSEGDLTQDEHDALMLLRTELGVPLTPGGVASLIIGKLDALKAASVPVDLTAVTQAVNDAKAAAVAAQVAAQAAQTAAAQAATAAQNANSNAAAAAQGVQQVVTKLDAAGKAL